MVVNETKRDVVLMTISCFVKNCDRETMVRGIIDSASQRSYLSATAANRIKLNPIRKEKVVHGLFGGVQTAAYIHQVYKVSLKSIRGDFECMIEVLEQDIICSEISPIMSEDISNLLEYDNITLAHHKDTPSKIELLIGADIVGHWI